MKDSDRINEVVERIEEAEAGDAPSAECPDGFWLRLLRSLRVSISPGKSFRQPVREVKATGGADF